MNVLSNKKLIQNLDEAFIHLKRLFYAVNHITSFFPLTNELMLTMSEENIGYLDQFIFRFMKLQDCIGQRLFSSLLECLQEDYSSKPFIDILNRLEKLEIIESTYIWQVISIPCYIIPQKTDTPLVINSYTVLIRSCYPLHQFKFITRWNS